MLKITASGTKDYGPARGRLEVSNKYIGRKVGESQKDRLARQKAALRVRYR